MNIFFSKLNISISSKKFILNFLIFLNLIFNYGCLEFLKKEDITEAKSEFNTKSQSTSTTTNTNQSIFDDYVVLIVQAGIVADATCFAFELLENGLKGSLISYTQTDAEGKAYFLRDQFENYGDVMFKCHGGNYIDEATGEKIYRNQFKPFEHIRPNLKLEHGNDLIPLSTLTTMSSQYMINKKSSDLNWEDLKNSADEMVSEVFGVESINQIAENHKTYKGSQNTRGAKMMFILASICQGAKNSELTCEDFSNQLVEDFKNGKIGDHPNSPPALVDWNTFSKKALNDLITNKNSQIDQSYKNNKIDLASNFEFNQAPESNLDGLRLKRLVIAWDENIYKSNCVINNRVCDNSPGNECDQSCLIQWSTLDPMKTVNNLINTGANTYMTGTHKFPDQKIIDIANIIKQKNIELFSGNPELGLIVEMDPQSLDAKEYYNLEEYKDILQCKNAGNPELCVNEKWNSILDCFDSGPKEDKAINRLIGDNRFLDVRKYYDDPTEKSPHTKTHTQTIFKNIYSIIKQVVKAANQNDWPILGFLFHEMDEHFCSTRLGMQNYIEGGCIPKQCTKILSEILRHPTNKKKYMLIPYGGIDSLLAMLRPDKPSFHGDIEHLKIGESANYKSDWKPLKTSGFSSEEINCPGPSSNSTTLNDPNFIDQLQHQSYMSVKFEDIVPKESNYEISFIYEGLGENVLTCGQDLKLLIYFNGILIFHDSLNFNGKKYSDLIKVDDWIKYKISDDFLFPNSPPCTDDYAVNTLEFRLASTGTNKNISSNLLKKVVLKDIRISRTRNELPYYAANWGFKYFKPIFESNIPNTSLTSNVVYQPSNNYDISEYLDGAHIAPFLDQWIILKPPYQRKLIEGCVDPTLDYFSKLMYPFPQYTIPIDFDFINTYKADEDAISNYQALKNILGKDKYLFGHISFDQFSIKLEPFLKKLSQVKPVKKLGEFYQKTQNIFDGYVRYRIPSHLVPYSETGIQSGIYENKPSIDINYPNMYFWPKTFIVNPDDYYPKFIGHTQEWRTSSLKTGIYSFNIKPIESNITWFFDWRLNKISNGKKEIIYQKSEVETNVAEVGVGQNSLTAVTNYNVSVQQGDIITFEVEAVHDAKRGFSTFLFNLMKDGEIEEFTEFNSGINRPIVENLIFCTVNFNKYFKKETSHFDWQNYCTL